MKRTHEYHTNICTLKLIYQFSGIIRVCVCGRYTLHYVNMLSLQKYSNKIASEQRAERDENYEDPETDKAPYRGMKLNYSSRVQTHTWTTEKTSPLSHVNILCCSRSDLNSISPMNTHHITAAATAVFRSFPSEKRHIKIEMIISVRLQSIMFNSSN